MCGDIRTRVSDGVKEAIRGKLLWKSEEVGQPRIKVGEVLSVQDEHL